MKTWLISICLVISGSLMAEDLATDDEPSVYQSQVASAEQLQNWFDKGYEAFQKERYHSAANSLSKFVSRSDSDTLNTDWGGLFLALSYEKQGLSHAAVYQFNKLLKQQATPQIVNAALARLEAISRTDGFDDELLINQTVLSQDFGFVDDELQDFVAYQQGRYNWSQGFIVWGDRQFAKLQPGSYYDQKYQILSALRAVYKGQIPTALQTLEALLAHPNTESDNKAEAQLMLARLNYEKKQYPDAISQYQAVSNSHTSADSTLLEEAWASFQNEQPTRALGLLHAFSAPSLAQSFSPEYYILKTHIYKSHCHYDSASASGEQFFERYQPTLDGIYARLETGSEQFNELHNVLLQNTRIAAQWSFLKLLVAEQKSISVMWNNDLKSHLKNLYRLAIENTKWKLSQSIEQEFERVANTILIQAEEMDLISYEMGVERYQTSPTSAQLTTQENEIERLNLDGKVSFAVDGEFWNDELNDYLAELSDDCLTTQTWSQF